MRAALGRAALGGRAAATVALVLLLAVHVVVAWYPFEFDPPRPVAVDVTRLADGSLSFGGDRVVARGTPPWDPQAGLPASGTVTVDLEVRPARTRQGGPARILTVSDDYHTANLMVGQHGSDVVVRVRRADSDAAGSPPLRLRGALAADRWVRIRVEVTPTEVLADVDGERRVRRTGAPAVRSWDPAYPVFLGDEPLGDRVWHGRVRHATVEAGGHVTDYLTPGALDVPDRVWFVPDRLREVGALPGQEAALRSLLHLVAFVPLGALLVVARRPAPVSAAAWAAALGVVLQLGKVAFAGRHPSWLTVLAQAAGALAGAAAALEFRRRGPR